MRLRISQAIFTALLCLAGCSDAPKTAEKAKEPEKPPEPVTGRVAFYKMYQMARGGWAIDLEPLQLRSIRLTEVKDEPGKAAAWQATFISPKLQKARNYTYSVIESTGNLHQGVFAGLEEAIPRNARPFRIEAFKKDSDEVLQTAAKHRTAVDYEKKSPGKTMSFLLESNIRFPNLAWRVIWGESVGTSNFSIFVDASTGEYLQTMR